MQRTNERCCAHYFGDESKLTNLLLMYFTIKKTVKIVDVGDNGVVVGKHKM
jgi:hypothetical protein